MIKYSLYELQNRVDFEKGNFGFKNYIINGSMQVDQYALGSV